MKLTKRQIEILNKVAEGKSNELIAYELFISKGSLRTHLKHIYHLFQITGNSPTKRIQLILNWQKAQTLSAIEKKLGLSEILEKEGE